jgi:hypothetical protein
MAKRDKSEYMIDPTQPGEVILHIYNRERNGEVKPWPALKGTGITKVIAHTEAMPDFEKMAKKNSKHKQK